ncbi:diguanylate cyclase domain-containing protein [Cytobacillus sp. Hz8]|uniref:diguanylate cyclase domain-containing protein n=1 Tax=Cytobacillus sp. Hz8 TaxID=3347168 RepID=UPI0035D87B9D
MLLYIFKDLTINLTIFTSVIFLTWLPYRDKIQNINQRNYEMILKEKIMIGIIFAILGTFIMFCGIKLDGALIDLRHLAIVVSAMFGGLPAAIITGLLIGINRFFFIDGFNIPSYIGLLNAINMGVMSGFIVTLSKKNSWLYMNLYCIFSTTLVLFLLIHDYHNLLPILVSFWFISAVSGLLINKLINYIKHTVRLQEQMNETLQELQDMKCALDEASIVSMTNKYGVITYVNDKFVEVSGFSRSEIIGNTHRMFNSGYHSKELFQELWDTIQAGRIWKGEIRNLSKDGHFSWFETTIVPFMKDGKIKQYVTVRTDVTDRKNLVWRMKNLTNLDGLTEITNRRYFDYKIQKEWNHSLEGYPLSFILLDIDHFKAYNDTYGHMGGDECLRRVAKKLVEIASADSYTVSRYGGEEFGIILPYTKEEEAIVFAERVRKGIEALAIEHLTSKTSNIITISLGVATIIPTEQNTIEELIQQADEALYFGKNNGRNRVHLYNQSHMYV